MKGCADMYKQTSGTYYEVWNKYNTTKLLGNFKTEEEARKAIEEDVGTSVRAGYLESTADWNIMKVEWQTIKSYDEVICEAKLTVKV